MNLIIDEIKQRADEVRYHDNPILEIDQPEYLHGLAKRLEKAYKIDLEIANDHTDCHDECQETTTTIDNELVKLHDDLLDKNLTITRTALAKRVEKMRKILP